MELNFKKITVLLLAAFAIGIIVGKYTIPAKVVVKTEEKIVTKEVIKWKEKKVKNESKDKEVVIIEIKYPDGTVRKEKRIVDKGTLRIDYSKEGSKESTKTEERKTEVSQINSKYDWHVSGMVSPKDFSKDSIEYGLSVERRILGPFYLGIYGTTNRSFGGLLGVSF